MYNEHKKKSIGKKLNKRIKKIEKADKIGGGKGGYFARHLDNDYSVEDNIKPIPEERKEDEYTKLQKFFDDVNKRGIELKIKKKPCLKLSKKIKRCYHNNLNINQKMKIRTIDTLNTNKQAVNLLLLLV
jgi:hypothetical protein